MPLGLFSSNSSKDGPKPQPLTSEKEERTSSSKRDKSGSASGLGIDIKDSKGSTFKLGKKSYTVEKKLAEGGFALVYLVCDKHSRNYALKRQLIKDDARQVEACRTESQIVKNLNGHKNIVAYIDHQLTVNKAGVYDYMLLTVYYPTNVLQLMNSRLLSNRCLSCQEILDIFCDVCEAVARLHHSKTPVIHRDLKVENVLIDQRTGSEKQVYVLCDYGSATTKVLSKDTYTQAYMEEEIQRYTTLSYRAPEMIDVFSGVPIDTKSDIWALGILLYKLCYFSLPFGESALAIQNGTFTFPDTPNIPDELKAIINLLLTSSAKHRPNIFQTAYLVFAAANRKCPVYNIEKGPRIELAEAVQILRLRDKLGANYARLFEKAFNEFEEQKRSGKGLASAISPPNAAKQSGTGNVQTGAEASLSTSSQVQIPSTQSSSSSTNSSSTNALAAKANEQLVSPAEGMIVNTALADPRSSTTSVNPRLRPKASTTAPTTSAVSNRNNALPSPFTVGPNMSPRPGPVANEQQTQTLSGNALVALVKPSTSSSNLSYYTAPIPADTQTNFALATPKTSLQHNQSPRNHQPAELPMVSNTEAFQSMKLSQISTDSSKSAPTEENAFHKQLVVETRTIATLPANVQPSCLRSSAFQPYTIASQRKMGKPSTGEESTTRNTQYQSSSSMPVPIITPVGVGTVGECSNPFKEIMTFIMTPGSPPTAFMDDNVFGERFDELRRVNRRNTFEAIGSGQAGTKNELYQHFQPTQKTLSVSSPPPNKQQTYSPFQVDLDAALEKAFDCDPFGCAPPILPHQMYYCEAGGVHGSGASSGDKLSSGTVGVTQRI